MADNKKTAADWIKTLSLEPMKGKDGKIINHIKPTYYSTTKVTLDNTERPSVSSMYCLHQRGSPVVFQKQAATDILMFYMSGAPLEVLCLDEKAGGKITKMVLGHGKGQQLQVSVPANTYMAYRHLEGGPDSDYSLVGTVAAPAYDIKKVIVGKIEELLKRFPKQKELIMNFTMA